MAASRKQSAIEIVDDHRRCIVERVVADMERDGLRWAQPYLPSLTPSNPATGTVYHGGNRLHLALTAFSRGYEDHRWCTFNQIRDRGWHLRKGSKAAIIERWRDFSVREKNEDTGKQEVTGHFLRLIGYWSVFNASEIEGIPPEQRPRHEGDRTAAIAADLIESSRCPVKESRAYMGLAAYAPGNDRILIAPRDTFRSDESFTRVLLHEMTHSTGHPSALDRSMAGRFGSPEYAKEELVAELGSLFTSSDLGIQDAELSGEFYDNHVAYLKSWIRALEDDPSYLFKAASQADKASGYLMERYEAVVAREQPEPERVPERVSLRGEAAAMRRTADAQPSAGASVPDLACAPR